MNTPSMTEWAALITYRNEGMYGCRWIIHGCGDEEYVADVASGIATAISPLVDHHAEYVNASELELLHEAYGDGEYPESGWDCDDVQSLLRSLPDIALAEYEKTKESAITETNWYRNLINFLNSEFPFGDGVWINFEGTPESFLANLVEVEVERYSTFDQFTEAAAKWLGSTLILSKLPWNGDVSAEQHWAFCNVINEFNEDDS